jgi:hypothetical protein
VQNDNIVIGFWRLGAGDSLVRDSLVRGSLVRGSLVRGSRFIGSLVRGSLVRGSRSFRNPRSVIRDPAAGHWRRWTIRGFDDSTIQGLAIQGLAIRDYSGSVIRD